MIPDVKICGLTTREAVDAAIAAGAAYVGFVFYPPSPRALSPDEAEPLAEAARGWSRIVALTVDADDALIAEIERLVLPDIYQLHGSETPDRVREIGRMTGKLVMKALKIADASDLEAIEDYDGVADLLLFDARPKPGEGLGLPGGNGVSFDWSLVADLELETPFMLSGGLDAGNIAEALAETDATIVDVSSGVERSPGIKDPERIHAFVGAVKSAATRHMSA